MEIENGEECGGDEQSQLLSGIAHKINVGQNEFWLGIRNGDQQVVHYQHRRRRMQSTILLRGVGKAALVPDMQRMRLRS